MNVTMFGTGYVGLVTGTCFAEMGNDVLCVDIDPKKVAELERGIVGIHEPGLEPMVRSNVAAGRLAFTTDPKRGVEHGEILFIAVGTPQAEDGSWPGAMVVAFGPKKVAFKGRATCVFDLENHTGEVHGRGTANLRAARIGVMSMLNSGAPAATVSPRCTWRSSNWPATGAAT